MKQKKRKRDGRGRGEVRKEVALDQKGKRAGSTSVFSEKRQIVGLFRSFIFFFPFFYFILNGTGTGAFYTGSTAQAGLQV